MSSIARDLCCCRLYSSAHHKKSPERVLNFLSTAVNTKIRITLLLMVLEKQVHVYRKDNEISVICKKNQYKSHYLSVYWHRVLMQSTAVKYTGIGY